MQFLHRKIPYLHPKYDEYKVLDANNNEIASLIYHDIFDYPLTFAELIRWSVGRGAKELIDKLSKKDIQVKIKDNFYFLQGRDGLVYKRILREKISDKKLAVAHKAASFLSMVPTIKMVAVTGALAMRNAGEDADIDLMIVTRKNTLWTTRLFTLLLLDILGLPRRKYGEKNQKDKLCLNIWLDEKDVAWKKRNIFTAHEISQAVPLLNKDKTYEKFIYKNRWIFGFWPTAVKIRNRDLAGRMSGATSKKSLLGRLIHNSLFFIGFFEPLAFWLQYQFMKRKITKEKVSKTRALFHPYDWSKTIQARLQI